MPATDAAALLRRNATDSGLRDRPAVKFDDQSWTHAEFVAEACRWAQLFLDRKANAPAPDGALHVGVLLDNRPEYLFALGGAALAGATVVGLNHTRREEHLLHDITHTHVGLIVTESRHQPLLGPITADLPEVLPTGSDLDAALGAFSTEDPGLEPGPDTRWALIFTSGTSAAPKAVVCTQRRLLVTGNRMGMIMGIGPDDVGYVCMPLFHSNAVMVGWAPSIVYGAAVGLGRRFSASRWLAEVRSYGATYFNYTGKPLAYLLATPELPDDGDNPLRVAFGNEGSAEVVDRFARRYQVEVIDAYGATEGGVAVNREVEPRGGALGLAGPGVKVVNEHGEELPRARFDADGRLENADECVGEIVNTAGAGPFEGYYNNPEANEKTLRFGWYWTGDLGYVDDDGYLYFAGRNADWIRVDGENFPAAPIEAVLGRHPDVVLASVYGVPDDQAGDQVMAGLVLGAGVVLDPERFAAWMDEQDELGPKWRPRYVRVLRDPPTTGTNKIVTRHLARQKWRADLVAGDPVFVRLRGDATYRPFTADDERELQRSFARHGRERFWDL
jgi:acyl-CoA synthetase (AMP-forming)/AMP-acid ligase II